MIPQQNILSKRDDKGYYREISRLSDFKAVLGIDSDTNDALIQGMPFSEGDITVGSENELQVVVIGNQENIDLPIIIKESNYYKNIIRRAASGDASSELVDSLDNFLEEDDKNIWENSWVRFPKRLLSLHAQRVLDYDLLADKTDINGPKRSDADTFSFLKNNEEWVRMPVSYLLKSALADTISSQEISPKIRMIGEKFMMHFLNDNTSPETFSFYPANLKKEKGMGKEAAGESLKRFFLCQLLTMYANKRFRLLENGQEALVYFAPHPPIKQKQLNHIIPDSFYRELFMSPCLSGWNKGEDKQRYMGLCHQVLSRSQLNSIGKLKEGGIINRNLVVLPNMSNISLANNGTHISLGSNKLTSLLKTDSDSFKPADEKYYGDLAIKIIEHFLPVFVGTYSGAPYRLDFCDFHPEKVLGFLPHELDFTHLRMIWRRWKKKANLNCFGQPLTPFGPEMMDRYISRVFRLKGDFVPDFRLIDYLACPSSTDQSPALNGKLGNDKNLLKDLESLGVFDSSMSLYMLHRLRVFQQMGFSGFEGRHYSLFRNLKDDMGNAVNIQVLISAYAYKLILNGEITHNHIPDDRFIESERRQIFFGTAIGIPTFYILKKTRNLFLKKILKKTEKLRFSSRYPGYIRVYNHEYQKALINLLTTEASDLIEMLQLKSCMADLKDRVDNPEMNSVSSKLTKDILSEAGAKKPTGLTADEFNTAAETYYRGTLRKEHIKEGFEFIAADVKEILATGGSETSELIKKMLADNSIEVCSEHLINKMVDSQLKESEISDLIKLTLLVINNDMEQSAEKKQNQENYDCINTSSIH